MSYSRPASEVAPPVRPEIPPQGGFSLLSPPVMGAEAQKLAVQAFGKFAPLILSYQPASFVHGTSDRFYTAPQYSTGGLCAAGELSIWPGSYRPGIRYREVYRVFAVTDPARGPDPLVRKKVQAACASSVASGRWFTARYVYQGDEEPYSYDTSSSAVAAERGVRSIDQAVTAARGNAPLPFKLDCDLSGSRSLDCSQLRRLLASIDPREIAWVVRTTADDLPLCRETTKLEMLPRIESHREYKYVVRIVEEDTNCRSGLPIRYTMDHVTIGLDDAIIN